ncbi:uncharacterized protein [Pagrus major]|uniref:uncharacterized protein n=1 Tax=Pagrus major TaxID=143350 RepID=UPI003CC8AC0E
MLDRSSSCRRTTQHNRPDSPEPSCVPLRSDRSMSRPSAFKDGHDSTDEKIHQERPESPEPSCVSMKSDRSMRHPIAFKDGHDSTEPSCVSMKSDRSMRNPIAFKDGHDSTEPSCVSMKSDRSMRHPIAFKDGHDSTEPTCVSMKSDRSMRNPIAFKDGHDSTEPSCVSKKSDRSMRNPIAFKDGHDSTEPTCVSMKSDRSMRNPIAFKDGHDSTEPRCVSTKSDHPQSKHLTLKARHPPSGQGDPQKKSDVASVESARKNQPDLNSIFILLEENITAFVTNELKRIQRILSPDYPDRLEVRSEEEEVGDVKDEKQRRSSREAFLKITLHFLRAMKQEELADSLQSKTHAIICQRKLKSNLKKKFSFLFEGVAKAGKPTLLNQIYTELFITEGGTGEVNDEHEVRQIETASRKTATPEIPIKYEDIFKASPGRDKPIRTVMTKGVAGIGKTVLTQKFTLDWAEAKANQDIQFTFPFTFRELNVLRRKKYSLKTLLNHFFSETKEAGSYSFNKPQVVFIFDGLDECRLPLDFHHNKILTDVTKSTSLDVLLTNLIRGKLLPSARLWITTRPAAANQIPPECVDMVTEVRGFTDPQKEEYFRKRFRDEEQASRIISHIKTSRSLHIMCHIPVFCWITATVLKHVLKTGEGGELPKTLTEMYIHFLVVQSKLKNVKYDGGAETDPHWTPESREMILCLGKLAFEQLQKGNLIFYESDLTECGIDIRAASVYSGVFTQIFKEERGLYQDRVFCFVHLSVQEFLAAVHVHLTFVNHGVNLLLEVQSKSKWSELFKDTFANLYQSAVDKALQSPNGHLDLFLRFLLGLSLETNQALLEGLTKREGSSSQNNKKTVEYIKKMIRKNLSPERNINLFYCLNELKDQSLLEEIQQYMASGRAFAHKLSPAQWSALIFILLSSEKHLNVFDLKEFSASDEGFLRLLPVIRSSNKSLLSDCNLSGRSLAVLATVLSSQSCSLTELDLSTNNLQDSGVKLLCGGLESPNCKLETLWLNQTGLTETCCQELSSVFGSKFSTLRELNLNHNKLLDSGVKLLCVGLGRSHCKMEGLGLSACDLSERSCKFLGSVLSSRSSSLRKLDLSMNSLRDSGVKLISAGLQSPHCKLETLRLRLCGLTEKSCGVLASVLSLKSSCLRALDASNNDLQDSGVMQLSAALGSPGCRLKTLSLSGCQVTEAGCNSLASALSSNPFNLRELDLSYNHPGESGVKLLSAKLKDPHCRLDTLRIDNGGAQRLKLHLRKYACYLTLDPNTVPIGLTLSEVNRKVTEARLVEKQSGQVLCTNGVTGRCYWEVKWKGLVSIGVTYKRGNGEDAWSWFLVCSYQKYSVRHNYKEAEIHGLPFVSDRVGVYVDWPAGILSFFAVFSDKLIHLHTRHCTFIEPLYPAIRLKFKDDRVKCSASLCDL